MIRFLLSTAAAAASISTHGIAYASTLTEKSIIDQAIERSSECAIAGEFGGTQHMSDLLHCPTTAVSGRRTDTKDDASTSGLCDIFGGTVIDGECRVCITLEFVDVEVCCTVSSTSFPWTVTCDLDYPCPALSDTNNPNVTSVKVTAECDLGFPPSCSCTGATFNGEACEVCTISSTIGPQVDCSNVDGPDGLDICLNLCSIVNGTYNDNGACEVCDEDVADIDGVDGCCAFDISEETLTCDGCIELDPEGERKLCGEFTCLDFGTDCSGSFDFVNDDELPSGALVLEYGQRSIIGDDACAATWDGEGCDLCEMESGGVVGASSVRYDCRNRGGRANIKIEEEVDCSTFETFKTCYAGNDKVCVWDKTNSTCVDFIPVDCISITNKNKCKNLNKGVCMWDNTCIDFECSGITDQKVCKKTKDFCKWDKTEQSCADFVKVDCPALVNQTACKEEKKQCKWNNKSQKCTFKKPKKPKTPCETDDDCKPDKETCHETKKFCVKAPK